MDIVDNFLPGQLGEVRPVSDAVGGIRRALDEAEAVGVLPVTSVCNVACLFCSNQANPPGVRVYRLGPRPLADLAASLQRMSHLGAIVIGESAFRLSEGEPLTHPDFEALLPLLRRKAPDAVLKLTTNGTLLSPERVARLADCGPVEVTLSVNTTSPEAYRRLHRAEHDPRRGPALLAAAGLPFHASVVAVPAITGPDDLAATAAYLEDHGCLDCRVLIPGYTRFTSPAVRALLPERQEVAELVERVRETVGLPLTLEPPAITDLRARLAGVGRDTPAARSGLRAGDVLLAVNGREPLSRVDAFEQVSEALSRTGTCRLIYERTESASLARRLEATLDAGPGRDRRGRPGFILDRDVDPDEVGLVLNLARRLGARRVLILTSVLAAPILRLGLAALQARTRPGGLDRGWGQVAFDVVAVNSRVFGGSIACAGLLTLKDFASALASGVRVRPGDVLFLPPLAFDTSGLDLTGGALADLRPLLPKGTRLVVPGLATL